MAHRIKKAQLWTHRHYTEIRHWLILVIGIMVLVFSVFMVGNQNRLIKKVETLSQQNKTLSEQNRDLNIQTKKGIEENQVVAKQNRSYTKCIAQIFAQYTHNFLPITITNLDTCTVDAQVNTPTTATSGPSPSRSAKTAPSIANPPTPDPLKQETQAQSSPPPTKTNCLIDILNIHVGC